jgi:hypothetical protein
MGKSIGLGAVLLLALGLGGAGVSGCVVRERVVARSAQPAPCTGGVWVEGHRGPRGHWHPAHWRCPNVVEIY